MARRTKAEPKTRGAKEPGTKNATAKNPGARNQPARTPAGPVPGDYPIDTGTATLERDPYNPDGWILHVNGVPSSHVDLADPSRLDFEYMRWIAALLRERFPPEGGRPAARAAPGRRRLLHGPLGARGLPRGAAGRRRTGRKALRTGARVVRPAAGAPAAPARGGGPPGPRIPDRRHPGPGHPRRVRRGPDAGAADHPRIHRARAPGARRRRALRGQLRGHAVAGRGPGRSRHDRCGVPARGDHRRPAHAQGPPLRQRHHRGQRRRDPGRAGHAARTARRRGAGPALGRRPGARLRPGRCTEQGHRAGQGRRQAGPDAP